jgi:hypothetical protein
MNKDEKLEYRQLIADKIGYKQNLSIAKCNYGKYWRKGHRPILSICFDKPNNYHVLMEIVEELEEQDGLHIIIKGKECKIDKLYLTYRETIVNIDGETKQLAIFEAIAKYLIKKGE